MSYEAKFRMRPIPAEKLKFHRTYTNTADYFRITKSDVTCKENMEKFIEYSTKEDVEDYSHERWYGIKKGGSPAVMELAEHGWTEGLERMLKYFKDIPTPPKAKSFRRERRFVDHGMLDISRYITRDITKPPDDLYVHHYRRTVQGRSAAGITRLGIPISVSCGVKSEAYFWRGVAACGIYNSLARAGRPVEIWMYQTGRHVWRGKDAEDRMLVEVLVKEAGQPVNMERLAYLTALSGIFRVWGFQHICATPWGVLQHMTTPLDEAPPRFGENDLVISGEINTKERAVELISDYVGFMSQDAPEIRSGVGLT